MHGKIFAELRKYVESGLGPDSWGQLMKEAGLSKIYMPLGEYPDEELVALVSAASKKTGKSGSALLEDFGVFIAPELLRMYWALLKPEWKTLDVIENTENTIHSVVRLKNPGARPPELSVRRASPEEVVVTYTSARRMCSLAKGIVKGIAKHYGERIEIMEDLCMNKGSGRCQITVRMA